MRRDDAQRLARLLEQAEAPGPARGGAPTGDGELSQLVSLARTLETATARPSPRFPTALRERVLATVADEPPRPAWRAHLGGAVADVVAAWRYSGRSAVASGAVTMVLLLAAVFVGASLSLPGDPLYGLKDAYQQAQLSRASAPADVAALQLGMASAKIDEIGRAADRGRFDSLVSSATDAEHLTREAADALLGLHRDTGDADVLAPLAAFVDEHRPIVAGVQGRVAEVGARRALANLLITLDRVDARVATAAGACCPPDEPANAFWVISSPHESLRECPCPRGQPPASGDQPAAHDGAPPLEAPASQPAPSDGASHARPRWREGMRQGWDDTREGVRDTVDGVTDGVRESVDNALDGGLEGSGGEPVDGLRDTVDDTLDGAGDTVDDTLDGLHDALPDDGPTGDLLDRERDADPQSADPGEPGEAGGAPDDAPLEGGRGRDGGVPAEDREGDALP